MSVESGIARVTCDYCGVVEETVEYEEWGVDLPDGWAKDHAHRETCPACVARVLAHTRICVKVKEPTGRELVSIAMVNRMARMMYATPEPGEVVGLRAWVGP